MFTQEQKSNLLGRFAKADLNKVQDKDLRAKGLAIRTKQAGFTLLELLVVVGILAIIGGAMIANFGGQEAAAARGTATSAIAGVEDALRIFKKTTKGSLPNNMESLVCTSYAALTPATGAFVWAGRTTDINPIPNGTAAADENRPFGGTTNASGIGGGMGKKLADKFTLTEMPANAVAALNDVGITRLRFAAINACDNEVGAGTTAVTFAGGEIIAADSALQDSDIPAHAFEEPRPGGGANGQNRGRGFSAIIGTEVPLMLWNPGTNGYNNVKVGAPANAFLIGMGIGQASDLVGDGNAAFAKAPFYGDVGRDKYAHYIALVNIGENNTAGLPGATPPVVATAGISTDDFIFSEGEAYVQAVIDARGDFLDEEFAEFTTQKG